jgi:hypothetical protein
VIKLSVAKQIRKGLFLGCAIAQAVSRWLLTVESWVRIQVSPCVICGGQNGTRTGFCPSPLVFPVSIIPLLLHFMYHLGD